jgi:hypothetical protein
MVPLAGTVSEIPSSDGAGLSSRNAPNRTALPRRRHEGARRAGQIRGSMSKLETLRRGQPPSGARFAVARLLTADRREERG